MSDIEYQAYDVHQQLNEIRNRLTSLEQNHFRLRLDLMSGTVGGAVTPDGNTSHRKEMARQATELEKGILALRQLQDQVQEHINKNSLVSNVNSNVDGEAQ